MNEEKADLIFWNVLFGLALILTLPLGTVTGLSIKDNFEYQKPSVGTVAFSIMACVFWKEAKKRKNKTEEN